MRRPSALPFFVFAAFLALPALAKDSAPAPTGYLAPGHVNLLSLTPPPPSPGTRQAMEDMRYALSATRARTRAAEMRADADAEPSVFRFADVLGPNFTRQKLPLLAALMDRVRRAASPPLRQMKDHWKRPRPFVVNDDVEPTARARKEALNTDGRTYSYSYPSGNGAFGAICAIILSDMIPEKRAELFARGWEFGANRIVAGVHFLSDIEAGRIAAAILVYAMMQNPEFRRDFAEAKAELRSQLALSP
ncbi:MAG: acid phosphatase [Alphaproteobacteria bacterium]